MSSLKNLLISSLVGGFIGVVVSACGVKGDPLPPFKPAELGRGRPTYRRATESLKIENAHGVEDKRPNADKDEREEDEDEE